MQTTHLSSTGAETDAVVLQNAFNALRGGQRLVLRGEFVGAFSNPETAEGAEIVFDGATINGHDEWPRGALNTHNGGSGYTDGSLFVNKASNCRVWGEGDIVGSRGSGVRLNAEQGSTIEGLTIDRCRWQLLRVDGKAHKVRNIHAMNGGMFNPTDRSAEVSNWCNAVTLKDAIDCVAENMFVGYSYCEGLGITGSGNKLRNIQIHNCMSAALYLNNSGPVQIDGLLMTHDGLTHLRGGGPAGGLTFGLESADKQSDRPDTHGAVIRNVVAIGCGPGLAFRSQRKGASFSNILIENGTFYESREAKGKTPVAAWFTPDAAYNGVEIQHTLFQQTIGKRTNLKKPPVDLLGTNEWVTVAAMSPPRLPYSGQLKDYLVQPVGAQWWDTNFEPDPWQEEVETPDPVNPTVDLVALRAWLKEAADLPAQIEAWLAKGRVLVG